MTDPRIKQLKIKTGVLKRISKEKLSYEKEVQDIENKIRQMQEKGEEVYYIKKQDELLQESTTVVSDCQRRINVAYHDLKTLIDNETELVEDEDYQAALSVLESSKIQVSA